ncbi:MAG: hypothetical protein ABIJ56_12390 [Pseudomonadota bacterium]
MPQPFETDRMAIWPSVDLEPASPSKVTRGKVTIEATPVSDSKAGDVPGLLLDPAWIPEGLRLALPSPAFNLKITNDLDHVLDFANPVLVLLLDNEGNKFVPDYGPAASARYSKRAKGAGWIGEVIDQVMQKMRAVLADVDFLNEKSIVLPHRSESFFLHFDVTDEQLSGLKQLTLGLYEVGTNAGAVGEATQRAYFEFQFEIKMIKHQDFTKAPDHACGAPAESGVTSAEIESAVAAQVEGVKACLAESDVPLPLLVYYYVTKDGELTSSVVKALVSEDMAQTELLNAAQHKDLLTCVNKHIMKAQFPVLKSSGQVVIKCAFRRD